MNKISIKKVDKGNFEEFVSLIRRWAKYQKIKIEVPDKAAVIRLKKDGLGKSPKYVAYLGIVEGEPAGFITTFEMYSTFKGLPSLYIEDFFVLEEYRRKGVGKALFGHCIEVARDGGYCRLDWWGLKNSKSAVNFYNKIKPTVLKEQYFRLERDQLKKFD